MLPDREDASYLYYIHFSSADGYIVCVNVYIYLQIYMGEEDKNTFMNKKATAEDTTCS